MIQTVIRRTTLTRNLAYNAGLLLCLFPLALSQGQSQYIYICIYIYMYILALIEDEVIAWPSRRFDGLL